MHVLTAKQVAFLDTPKNKKYLAYSKIHLACCDFTLTINILLKKKSSKEYSLEQLIVCMSGRRLEKLAQFFPDEAGIILQELYNFIDCYSPSYNPGYNNFPDTVAKLTAQMNTFRVRAFILTPLPVYYKKVDETITPNRKIRDRGDGLQQLLAGVFNHMEEIQTKLQKLLKKNIDQDHINNNAFFLLCNTQRDFRQAAQYIVQLYEAHLQGINAFSAYIADAATEKKMEGEKSVFAILQQTLQCLPWFPSVILEFRKCSSFFDSSERFFYVQICYSMGDIFEPPCVVHTEYTASDQVDALYRLHLFEVTFTKDQEFLGLLITLLGQSIKLIHRSVSVPNISPCLPLIGPESNNLRKLDACTKEELIGLLFLCMLYITIFLPMEEEKIGTAQAYMRNLALFYRDISQKKRRDEISALAGKDARSRFCTNVIFKKSSTPEPKAEAEINKLVAQFPGKAERAVNLQEYYPFFHSDDQYSHAPAETDNNADATLGTDSAPPSFSKEVAITVRKSMS